MVGKFRMAAWLTALLFVFVCAASGCGGTQQNETDSTAAVTEKETGAEKAAADPLEKHLTVSIGYWGAGTWEQDAWLKDLCEKFNVTIKFVSLEGDWPQKVRLLAAGGDLPDYCLANFPSSDTMKMAREGLLKALPDDLSPYPNLKAYMDKDIMKYFAVDGGQYIVPRAHTRNFGSYDSFPTWRLYVRKDWMEKCGITKDPETVEEFLEMNRIFVEKNASGEDNTIGYTALDISAYTYPMRFALGTNTDNWMKIDGQWKPGFFSLQNVEWVRILQKYYKLGALDKDVPIFKGSEGSERFLNGKAGSFLCSWTNADYESNMATFEANTGKEASDCVKMILPLKDGKGVMNLQNDHLIGTGSMFSAKITDENFDRILRMMDYFLTDEGVTFGVYGTEGRDYKKEGGKIVLTTPKDPETGKCKPVGAVYPSSSLSSMVYWKVDYSNTDPNVSENIKTAVKAYDDEIVKLARKQELNWDLELWDDPVKAKSGFSDWLNGVIKIIVSDEDAENAYKALLDKVYNEGAKDAIEAVNNKFQ